MIKQVIIMHLRIIIGILAGGLLGLGAGIILSKTGCG
jgi:hypothetical protein